MAKGKAVVHFDEQQRLQIPIDWDVAGVDVVGVTNMTVQNNGHETILSFFCTDQPFLIGTLEEQAAQAKKVKSIKAKCVGRFRIASSRLATMGVGQPAQQNGQPLTPLRMLPAARGR